tara:strand:+ start:15002 stop:15361 length:360 start_codon:yes stop_codon:yes gene_type:complete
MATRSSYNKTVPKYFDVKVDLDNSTKSISATKVQFPKIKTEQEYLVLEFKFSTETYNYFINWIESDKAGKVYISTDCGVFKEIVCGCKPVFIELSDLRQAQAANLTSRVFLTPNELKIC